MSQLIVPPSVTQNIARSKSLVKRDEPIRALDALLAALDLFEPEKIVGKARSVVEINIYESVTELNSHTRIKRLIQEVAHSDKAAIAYKPGEEGKLAVVLKILRKALAEADAAKAEAAENSAVHRKEELLEKGKACLASGEAPRGKASLRRLSEEYGTEPGVLEEIGRILVAANYKDDAIEFLEQAIELFPRASGAYGVLADCYMTLREFEKGEALYTNAIKEFGAHPKTLVNLGKLYIAWNKRDKAFEVLNKAVRQDPTNEEAKELFAKVDR
ncbi:hypothetical protein LJC26_02070 [Desulfovibrio sp. OttesenSCG-928-O18]|nr:hypothetical protein [Desulfovibrio sp. OttesenSCG-928-O18]